MKRIVAMCLAFMMAVFLIPSVTKAASERVTIKVIADKTTLTPGDTVNFQVMLGAVENLGGLDFNVLIPDGLTVKDDSITMQDGLKDILKSDGDIVKPTQLNSLRWSYSVGSQGYTGTSELCILSFSCTVDADAALGGKNVTLRMRQCFDDSTDLNDIAVDLVPAAITVEKVKILVSGITLNKTSLTLQDGDSAKLTATVTPTNADNQKVTWSTSDESVATVSADGTVTAVKAGTANITVTTEDGGKTASCTLTVNCNHTTVKTEAVDAACETDGNIEHYTCSKCGKKFSDAAGTKEITDIVVKAKGHQTGAWQSDETNHWKICSVCKQEVNKSEHDYKWVADKAATEDETGIGHEECVCGSIRSEGTVLDKLDHVHVGIEHHEAVKATCTTEGAVEYWTCASEKCRGKYYGDAACQIAITEIALPKDPQNHVYTDDADADCNECGYKRFYLVTDGANASYVKGTEAGLTITADGDQKLFKSIEIDGTTIDSANYEVKTGSTVITLKKSYLDGLTVENHAIRILYTDGKSASSQFTVKEGAKSAGSGVKKNETSASVTVQGINSPKTDDKSGDACELFLIISGIALIVGSAILGRKKIV